jgi:hypothetical protein
MKGRRRVVAASPMSKMLAIVAAFIPDPVRTAAHRLAAKPRRGNSKTCSGLVGTAGAPGNTCSAARSPCPTKVAP